MLKSSLSNCDRSLTTEALSAAEGAKHNVCKPVPFAKQWCSQMQMYLKGSQLQFFRLVSQQLQLRADELEAAVPRWDFLFSEPEKVDWSLARSRLLLAPKRPMVAPLIKHMKAIAAEVKNCQDQWCHHTAIEASISSYAEKTMLTGESFLVVVAGVNTICNFGSSESQAKMATEVMEYAKRKQEQLQLKENMIPDALKLALEKATAGQPPAVGKGGG